MSRRGRSLDGRSSAARRIRKLEDDTKKLVLRAEHAERVAGQAIVLVHESKAIMAAMDEHHTKNGDGSLKSVAALIAEKRDRFEKAVASLPAM